MKGILIVDKPLDWTSHDVVNFIRKRFRIKKVGHCGTLDPIGTGVLVILAGKATKWASRFLGEDKEYQVTLTLGVTTDTADAQGKIIFQNKDTDFSRERLEEVFKQFLGELAQIPPMVSALRHKGKRLYQLAREGKEVPREPRKIHIHKLEITSIDLPRISFDVRSSKGTYIRTLCEDIGKVLGCGAHLSALRRIKSGSFSLEKSVTIDKLKQISRLELEDYFINADF